MHQKGPAGPTTDANVLVRGVSGDRTSLGYLGFAYYIENRNKLKVLGVSTAEESAPADILHNPQGLLDAPFDSFTALPIPIFNWVSRPQMEYQHVAAAGIVVLLAVLPALNAAAILIRNRFQKRMRW